MATVLKRVKPAKAGRCRDCRAPLGDRLTTWPARCDRCDDAAEARRALEAILAGGDPVAISQAAGWLSFVETDSAVFRSARAVEILDRAVRRACKAAADAPAPVYAGPTSMGGMTLDRDWDAVVDVPF